MARSRALARRAQRLLGFWRSEQRTFRQGLVALDLSSLAGFVAGLTLAHLTGNLTALPGLLMLTPAAVGLRGTIFGAMGARLGTAQAAGLLTPLLDVVAGALQQARLSQPLATPVLLVIIPTSLMDLAGVVRLIFVATARGTIPHAS